MMSLLLRLPELFIMETVKMLIDIAKRSGADANKFQKKSVDLILTKNHV